MRGAATAKRLNGAAHGAAHNATRAHHSPEENAMMASITDLIQDNESLGHAGAIAPFKPTLPHLSSNLSQYGSGGGNHHRDGITSPKHELFQSLQTVQNQFADELGQDWWRDTSSSSSDDRVLSGCTTALPSVTSATPCMSVQSSSNSSDYSADVISTIGSTASAAATPAQASPHMHQIMNKLEALKRPALLAYAARISIMLGNFYQMMKDAQASEQAANTAMAQQQQHDTPDRKLAHQLSISGPWSPSAGRSLVDWASVSRPLSSMTTASEMPGGFSASTQSLMHLPAVNEQSRLDIHGDLEDGTKTINDYVIVASIGQGSFGTVELGVTLGGEPRAIKSVKRSALLARNEAMIRREIAIMKKLRHDNVVRLYEVIDDPSANVIYLVMKYCQNGPIVQMRPDFTCDTIPLAVAKTLLRQLLSGLSYMHLRRIVHRDIKPDNILLDHANVPCFVDFGVSGSVHHHHKSRTAVTTNVEGTPMFWAPEVFARLRGVGGALQQTQISSVVASSPTSSEGRGSTKNGAGATGGSGFPAAAPVDLMAADVYSLGATFYAVVCGVVPFVAHTQTELAELVINEPLRIPDFVPKNWKDLLSKMLEKDPQKRAKIPTLKLHPVFTEDAADLSSPHDDINVSEREIHESMNRIKRDDDGDHNDGSSGHREPHTPTEPMKASARAVFHRKVPPGRTVVAASSATASGSGGPGLVQPFGSLSASNVVSGSAPPHAHALTRSMSTSRMPLRNIVRASDNNAGAPALPPINTARRPNSMGH